MVRQKRFGYTLVEMMIAVAILGVMSSVAARLTLQVNRFFILTRVRLNLQREARGAMYVITRELRQGQANTIVIDQVTGQPYYSRISFAKIQGQTMSFYQSGGNLMMRTGTQTSTLSTHLIYLGFTFPRSEDMSILSVSMTLQESIYQGGKKALHMASEKVQVMN